MSAGVDANRDGLLDPEEVTQSETVCSGELPVLSTTTPSGPSDQCNDGGVIVASGPDRNGNGTLEPDEVTTRSELCAHTTRLTRTSSIPAGDPRCPFGGSLLEAGTDDGASGGIAGNGVLEEGEVMTSRVTCLSGGAHPRDTAPPEGEPGTGRILLGGAAGSAGSGGHGGRLQIENNASNGGHVALFRTGMVRPPPPVPRPVLDFGPEKLHVTQDLALVYHASPDDAANGEYYYCNTLDICHRKSDTEKAVIVTGIHVANSSYERVLANDILNEGTIAAAEIEGGHREDLRLGARAYFGSPGSKIDAASKVGTSGDGGFGAYVVLVVDYLENHGVLNLSGADAAPGGHNGGPGGTLNVLARSPVGIGIANLGTVLTRGGSGTGTGKGGRGGIVAAHVNGPLVSTGDIDTSGGSGATGGVASFVNIDSRGSLAITGRITTRGGDAVAAGCTTTCSGGAASYVTLRAYGGGLTFSGTWVGTGGASVGTAGQGGGTLTLETLDGAQVAGSVTVSGTLDARGGTGTTGGNGGAIYLKQKTARPAGQEVRALGFAEVDVGGGTGTTGGGFGGRVVLGNGVAGDVIPSGSVLLHVPIDGKGGAATESGRGGEGTRVNVLAGSAQAPAAGAQAFVFAAPLEVAGGAGISGGGASGVVGVYARDRIDVHTPFAARGGDASGESAAGGAAGDVEWETLGELKVGATITLSGGDGLGTTSAGGACGGLFLSGAHVTANALLACTGGNGTAGPGGGGGPLTVTSSQPPSELTTLSAQGGSGTPPGAAGVITVDGKVM